MVTEEQDYMMIGFYQAKAAARKKLKQKQKEQESFGGANLVFIIV